MFDELKEDERYLVYLRKYNMEKAIVAPSRAWLGVPLTYAKEDEVLRVDKVKIINQYDPVPRRTGFINRIIDWFKYRNKLRFVEFAKRTT